MWIKKRKSLIGNRIFVHHRTVSAVRRVEFVSGMKSYIILICRWRNTIVMNVHATSEEKIDAVSKQGFQC